MWTDEQRKRWDDAIVPEFRREERLLQELLGMGGGQLHLSPWSGDARLDEWFDADGLRKIADALDRLSAFREKLRQEVEGNG